MWYHFCVSTVFGGTAWESGMKRIVSIMTLSLLSVTLVSLMSFNALRQGLITPSAGTLRMGPVTVMVLPPCPTIPHGSLVQWGRRCGSASPWAVWLIMRSPNGERQQWQLVRMIIDP
jgi:hypothetical protein